MITDDPTPATRGDLLRLEERVDARFKRLEENLGNAFKRMDERFTRVNEGIDSVLDVLVTVDKRDKANHKDHEKRIVRLERVAA